MLTVSSSEFNGICVCVGFLPSAKEVLPPLWKLGQCGQDQGLESGTDGLAFFVPNFAWSWIEEAL